MLKHIGRKLAIGVTLAALVTPAAFAATHRLVQIRTQGRPAWRGPIVLVLLGLG